MDFQGEEGFLMKFLRLKVVFFVQKKISGGKSWETALSFKLSFFSTRSGYEQLMGLDLVGAPSFLPVF